MDDEKLLKEYKLTEKSFIVVMVTKPTLSSNEVESKGEVDFAKSNVNISDDPKEKGEIKQPCEKEEEPVEEDVQDSTNRASGNSNIIQNDLVIGEDYEKTIKEMSEMGFERSQVHLFFNNMEKFK